MKVKMGEKRVDYTYVLFFVITFLGLGALIFTIYYNEFLLRILSYAFFVVGYLLYYHSISTEKVGKAGLYSVIFIVYILFTWVNNEFEYNILINSMSFFLIFSAFESVKTIKPNKKLLNIIYSFYLIQGLLLVLTSFSKYAYMCASEDIIISNDLLLGFSNANETGMILAYTIIGFLLCLTQKESKLIRIFTSFIIVYLFYLLIITRARTSFIGVILFICLSFIYKNKKGRLFTSKKLYLIFIGIPLFFVPIYISLFRHFINRKALFGKTLFSGRQEVYFECLQNWSNKILGNISTFFLSNAHNGFFTIIINYGILGIVLYLLHLIINLNDIKNNKCYHEISRMGFIAILCLYFMSATEAAFIVSGKFYYSNFLIISWLANYNEGKEGNSNEKNTVNN